MGLASIVFIDFGMVCRSLDSRWEKGECTTPKMVDSVFAIRRHFEYGFSWFSCDSANSIDPFNVVILPLNPNSSDF